MTIPVAFIIFNRPDTTARVFAEIRRHRPERLLVVADGARKNRPGESERCAATRRIIDEGVDWPCKIERCWSDVNLGCRNRVSTGLSWVFSRSDSAIVLEDDCLPDPSFFPFCSELLVKYADDARIGSISGCNFLTGRRTTQASYRYSRFSHIWGWASWTRAWKHYDVNLTGWPALRSTGWLRGECSSDVEADFWRAAFDGSASGRIDTWDFQWIFANWANRMAGIVSSENLISNIGFGSEATHTTASNPWTAMPTTPIEPDLRHPTCVHIDHDADSHIAEMQYRRSWKRRLWDRFMVRQ